MHPVPVTPSAFVQRPTVATQLAVLRRKFNASDAVLRAICELRFGASAEAGYPPLMSMEAR